MVCALLAALVAAVVFAIFEVVSLQRRLRRGRMPQSESRLAEVAAAVASTGLLGVALGTMALMFRYGLGERAGGAWKWGRATRPLLVVCSSAAGALLLFVIAALGCDQRKRCKERHSLGSDKVVGVVGLLLSLSVVATATLRLKHCWR